MDGTALMNTETFIFFLIMCFVAVLGNAEAATFSPQQVSNVVKTSTGATAATKYAAMTAANQSIYAMRAVNVSKSSIANVVRTRAFTPWGIALTVALTAAGYALNDSDDSISTETAASQELGICEYGGQTGWTVTQCLDWSASHIGIPQSSLTFHSYAAPNKYRYGINGSAVVVVWVAPYYLGANDPRGGSSLADDDSLYEVASELPQSQWAELFEDPLSGHPNPDIQEFQDVADDLTDDYIAENDADPNTNPDVNPEQGDTGTETVSEEEPLDEDPCVINPNLLVCMEMDEVPDPTDIQTQEVDASYSIYSLASNSSCPADIPSVHGASWEFDGPCQYASGIKPIVLAVFSILALMIASGYRFSES